ncbi:MAG: hypothetical protein C0P74_004565 [Gammaproteobacteria bacterium]|nr:hypothetical protein [Gammaproteobacteria bacterium]
MEFLLQWADDLDDAIHALRHLAPRIIGLLVAVLLFVATGFAFVRFPAVGLTIVGVVLSASLIDALRYRMQARGVWLRGNREWGGANRE